MAEEAPPPNLFGLTQYDGRADFFTGQPLLLPEGVGWGIVVGFGAVFALLAILLVWIDSKYAGVVYNSSEQFNTAGRSIGKWLLAVDVVSHWTWASILLQSVSYGWFYGLTGSYWFAANDALVVIMFGGIALELKHRAPKAHTMLELVKIFFCFAVVTNLLVSVSMLQGCVAVVNTLCGTSVYGMAYLIPLGVTVYAVVGGLKATFTTSYMHTVIIYVVVCIFMFKVFIPASSLIGDWREIWSRLVTLQDAIPVAGNRYGSYMTMWSDGGLQFEVIFFYSALAQMVVDQAYWQTAIAAKATAAVEGYFIGAILFMAIVFTLPVALGTLALGLDLPLSADEALAGLVMPASAYVILGKAGAVLVIIICFMAVTSSGASEMVAVSSLFTFDVYRPYINPKATGSKLVWISRGSVVVWAIVMGTAMVIVQAANINVNWLITVIGVITGGAVPPLVMALLWRRCSRVGACSGAVVGCVFGITSWLAYAKISLGTVTVATTGTNYPLICGNVVSNGTSLLLTIVLSFIFPEKEVLFNWERLDTELITVHDDARAKSLSMSKSQMGDLEASREEANEEQRRIARMRKPVWIIIAVSVVLVLFVWPLLTLPAGVFSYHYFCFYIVLAFIIMFVGAFLGTFGPIWEARHVIMALCLRKTVAEVSGAPGQLDKLDASGKPLADTRRHSPDSDKGFNVKPGTMDDSVRGVSPSRTKRVEDSLT